MSPILLDLKQFFEIGDNPPSIFITFFMEIRKNNLLVWIRNATIMYYKGFFWGVPGFRGYMEGVSLIFLIDTMPRSPMF